MKLTEIINFNPATRLSKGANLPFIDMATLPTFGREIPSFEIREFNGSGSKFQNGNTLLARITPCLENGKGGMVRELPGDGTGYGSTEFIVMRARREADSTFVYYLSRLPDFRNFSIHQMTGTSGRQRVAWQSLQNFEIAELSCNERGDIASLLGSLDDKIALNRRMNETLQGMARALFRDWFVDFGPTRAKMNGTRPYLAPDLWALFPDRLDSNTGLPSGWRVGTLGTCFHLVMGQSPPGHTYNDQEEGIPFFQGRTDFGFRYPKTRKFCSAPTRIAEHGDTLVSVRAPVGDINMAWETCCVGRGLAALRHISGSQSFTYYSALSLQQDLRQYEHSGTVFGSISKKQFEALGVLEPTPKLVNAFENQVAAFDERIKKNISENRTLAQTRDLLLPKLMSGTIRLTPAA
ncbi:MAG: restriction endonuclease subunit S [Rhodobacteraceae bacterium]|nr:restriction endonuclease subunit S [Paracoccaceae bacterium]